MPLWRCWKMWSSWGHFWCHPKGERSFGFALCSSPASHLTAWLRVIALSLTKLNRKPVGRENLEESFIGLCLCRAEEGAWGLGPKRNRQNRTQSEAWPDQWWVGTVSERMVRKDLEGDVSQADTWKQWRTKSPEQLRRQGRAGSKSDTLDRRKLAGLVQGAERLGELSSGCSGWGRGTAQKGNTTSERRERDAIGEGLLTQTEKLWVRANGHEKSQAILCDQAMGSGHFRIPFILKIQVPFSIEQAHVRWVSVTFCLSSCPFGALPIPRQSQHTE